MFFRFLDAWSCRRVLQNRELYIFHSVQCSGCGAFAGISEMSRKHMTSRPQLDQPIITMTNFIIIIFVIIITILIVIVILVHSEFVKSVVLNIRHNCWWYLDGA